MENSGNGSKILCKIIHSSTKQMWLLLYQKYSGASFATKISDRTGSAHIRGINRHLLPVVWTDTLQRVHSSFIPFRESWLGSYFVCKNFFERICREKNNRNSLYRMRHIVALFGEAEKGHYSVPMMISDLSQLADYLGNPPEESVGITLAIQALLYKRDILYLRVQEEGFSTEDYLKGLKNLEKASAIKALHAVCMPGVGDASIIEAASPITQKHKSLLITTEQDLYDYLTSLAS